jgi:uncharacterized protein (TIGR01777 family)
MRILVSGSSGFVGSALVHALPQQGHSIVRLRSGAANFSQPETIAWQADVPIAPEKVSGFDAAIHLAGENVFGRWSAAKKKRIYESRVLGTRNLCAALATSNPRPRALLAASAIGYYGARQQNPDDFLNESSPPGTDFLARLCCDWEAATQPAAQAGIRVVNLRFGLVLSARGGALAKMLPPFRLGLGGPLGSGRQWLSWIALDDAVAAILHCLATESVRGPVNIVAPNPVTNAEFSRTLAHALHRPAFLRVPAFLPKLLFGKEMAEETVLASQRVNPGALANVNFKFAFEELNSALQE